jgi:hypothetical protein
MLQGVNEERNILQTIKRNKEGRKKGRKGGRKDRK